jgi:hypothetical protein
MDPTVAINLGLLVVTGIAATFTGVGLVDARRSRSDARTARDEARDARDSAETHEKSALKAATASANAQTATAAALTEANEIARETLPPSPWDMSRDRDTIIVRNQSRRTLHDVDGYDMSATIDVQSLQDLPMASLPPNASLIFDYTKTLASPATTTLVIKWRETGEVELSEWAYTLY